MQLAVESETGVLADPPRSVHYVLDLETYFRDRQYESFELRSFQYEGIKHLLEGKSINLVTPTASGKTVVSFACLNQNLIRGKIGVYLVPQTRLLDQKVKEIHAFFGSRAKVIELSGQVKPLMKQLKEYSKRLIIVATYEAFRSFLFNVEHRYYFRGKKLFGAVVVDEFHEVGDESRGASLESLLYKLKEDHGSQFCFLSGTFPFESALVWSLRFNAQLIWEPLERHIAFDVVARERDTLKKKVSLANNICRSFFEEHDLYTVLKITDPESTGRGRIDPAKMLIFCRTRLAAEKLALEIFKLNHQDFDDRGLALFCQYIHAGLDRSRQDSIFDQFTKHKGLAILCCSPLLEAGIDVKGIMRVVITDAEKYSGIKLNQMLGRVGRTPEEEERSRIFFLVSEDKQEIFKRRIKRAEGGTNMLKNLEMEEITSQIDQLHFRRLLLEGLYRRQQLPHELINDFRRLLKNIKLEKEDLILRELFARFHYAGFINGDYDRFSLSKVGKELLRLQEAGKSFIQLLERLKSVPEIMRESRSSEVKILRAELLTRLVYGRFVGRGYTRISGRHKQVGLPRLAQIMEDTRSDVDAVIVLHRFLRGVLETPFSLLIAETLKGLCSLFFGFFLSPFPGRTHTRSISKLFNELTEAAIRLILAEFLKKSYIRDSKGRLGLTYVGEAIVETQLDMSSVAEFVTFLNEDPKPSARNMTVKIAGLAARQLFDQEFNRPPTGTIHRKKSAEDYIKVLSRDTEKNRHFQEEYGVLPGDHESYRKKALWLASSQYLMYRGRVLHESAERSVDQYYQVNFRRVLRKSEPTFRRMRRLIQRFQTEADDQGRSKPRLRPHRRRVKVSRRGDWILSVLRSKKGQGATVKEICWWIGACQKALLKLVSMFLGVTKRLYINPLPPSTIQAQLGDPLADQVSRTLEYPKRLGRSRYRYYLNEFRPLIAEEEEPLYTCKDCESFIENPRRPSESHIKTFCEELNEWRSGKSKPCPRFRWKVRNSYNFPKFKVTKKGVRCPRCGRFGTIRIPRFKEMIICRNEKCRARVWQVKKRMYHLSYGGDLPTARIQEKDDFLVVQTYQDPRDIFLEEGENLTVKKNLETGIHWLSITGARSDAFFLDEVNTIFLVSLNVTKLISPNDRAFLESETHIGVVEFTTMKVLRHEERKALAADLRVGLEEVQGIGLGLELARKMVFAKIKSNLHYTMKLRSRHQIDHNGAREIKGSILDSAKTRDLIVKQFDEVVKTYRTELDPDHLRSIEANAEQPAWQAQKLALTKEFWFAGRQAMRAVRTPMVPGSKARDPYNAGLNYLYKLLGRMGLRILREEGFGFFPGPGILHARERHSKKRRVKVKSKRNREFTFDFIDAYRPPFRHYLGHWIREGRIERNVHFERWRDEWWRYVFRPSKRGRDALNQLFDDVCNRLFYYRGEWLPLSDIMREEALTLAKILRARLVQEILTPWQRESRLEEQYTPFTTYEDEKLAEKIDHAFDFLDGILGERRLVDVGVIREDLGLMAGKIPALTVPELTPPKLGKNIIIVAHGDQDGFGSALLLFLRHFQRYNLSVFISGNQPNQFHRVLEKEVVKKLQTERQNIVYIADLTPRAHISAGRSFYRRLLSKFRAKAKDVRIIWFDHHPLENYKEQMGFLHDPSTYQESWMSDEEIQKWKDLPKIEFHQNLSETHAFKIIWEHFRDEINNELRRESQKSEFLTSFISLSKNLRLQNTPDFLKPWYDVFRFHFFTSRRASWGRFFYEICLRLRDFLQWSRGERVDEIPKRYLPRQTKQFQLFLKLELEPALMIRSLDFAPTDYGLRFVILQFREEYRIERVPALIAEIQRRMRDMLGLLNLCLGTKRTISLQFPDFAICQWHNHTITLESSSPRFNHAVNFSGVVERAK